MRYHKGIWKHRKTFFKKGHVAFEKEAQAKNLTVDYEETEIPSWKSRLTRRRFQQVTKKGPGGLLTNPDAEGNPGSSKLLRPTPDADTSISESYLKKDNKNRGEMRLVNISMHTEMWNKCIEEHSKVHCECRVPSFEVYQEIKKGLCWRQSLKCTKCGYISKLHKLYEEIEESRRGAKIAAPNVALQVALQDSTCGNAKARLILAGTNTPPPSRSGMQNLANKVGTITAMMTSDDLAKRREDLKEINSLRGLSKNSPINIGMDVRYNSNTIAGRCKMGQNASQAIGTAIEHQTDQKQIVAYDIRNQLCSKGKYLQKAGLDVTCPGGHPGCTANTSVTEPLSEYKIGEEIGNLFANQGILIRHVTTDGDARSADGVASAQGKVNPNSEVIRQADTTHLGQGLFKAIQRITFSKNMFPGINAAQRADQKKCFGLDIKERCEIIYNELQEFYFADAEKLKKIEKESQKAVELILDCYSGNCTHCRRGFTACGGGKLKCWWETSNYNWKGWGIRKFNMSPSDRAQVKAVLEMKFGSHSIHLQKLNSNTNKNEAINRGISASLPKNVNFSRNVGGRSASSIHRLNYGPGDSLLLKLETAGCPVTRGGCVAKAIRGLQKQSEYAREYKRRRDVRRRKSINKAKAICEHFRAKHERKKAGKKMGYRKHQLDPKPTLRKRAPPRKKKSTVLEKKNASDTEVAPSCSLVSDKPADLKTADLDHNYCEPRCSNDSTMIENSVNDQGITNFTIEPMCDHNYCKL